MAERGLLQDDIVCVYRKGKGYQFGTILENADSLSSSDEEDADNDRLKKGFVRIAWYPTGRESVIAENKVKLVERSLMPGDVIQRLLPGQDSQSGVIMDMEVKCHLHIKQTNKYIYNVDSKDLQPLQKFEIGQDVVMDDSLGRVIFVSTYLILHFSDGAKCRAEESDVANFDDISEKKERRGEFSTGEFYEGQELRGSLYNLSDVEWLHSTKLHSAKTVKKKGNHSVSVTVEKIVTDSVEVQWIFRIFHHQDPSLAVPQDTTVQGEQLKKMKVLDWFDYSSLEMADLMLYRIKNDDCISTEEPSQVFEPTNFSIKDTGCPVPSPNNKTTSDANACVEGGSNDAVSCDEEPGATAVTQEDGDFEDDSDSAEEADKTGSGGSKTGRTAPKKKRGTGSNTFKSAMTKFKSGKQQGQKGAAGTASSNNHKKNNMDRQVVADSLVNVEVMFTNSAATVMWQDGSVDYNIHSSELYPVDLDTYDFFPGDFVMPQNDMNANPDYGSVIRCSHGDRTCIVNWYKIFDGIKEKQPILLEADCEVSVYDIKEHAVFNFHHGQVVGLITPLDTGKECFLAGSGSMKFVGQILKLEPPGRLTVKWSDGTISQCFPQEVFKVMEEDDDDTSDESSYEDDSDSSAESWETESEQEIIGGDVDKDELSAANIIAKQKQELQTLLSRAESALIRLKTLLNSFDVSMTAPECFHDIIRIYRSCHDVDKILRSSFFHDPELKELISQAKLEVKSDKANKVSKHLSQLLESWAKSRLSDNVPDTQHRRTVRIGTSFSCNILNLTLNVSAENDSGFSADVNNEKDKSEMASGGEGASSLLRDPTTNNKHADDSGMEESSAGSVGGNNDAVRNARVLRKEYSEPVISSLCTEDRHPSDPEVNMEQSESNSMLLNNGGEDDNVAQLNLVGENCVGKDIKIAGGRSTESMKKVSGEGATSDSTTTNHTRQLCYKICENLQKQILKIHEEVNKRTNRIMSSAEGNKRETIRVESCNEPADHASNPECNTVICSESSAIDSKVGKSSNGEDGDGSISQDNSKSFNMSDVPTDVTDANEAKHSTEQSEQGESKDGAPDHANAQAASEGSMTPADGELSKTESDEIMMTSDDADGESVLPKGFSMKEEVGSRHKFSGQPYQPLNPRAFNTAVKKDLRLLQYSLPDGILIKGFENRLDLYSVLILGPSGTPYEDAFFLFDVMLPKDYPKSPPLCHYHSFCSERLNPNLYEDGKICVSLLGTWSGKGSEMWTAKSNLLQVLVSIQGLILVREPYYNEAGYERQRGTHTGAENSRMYNEMAILKTVQSLTRMCHNLPAMFEEESKTHLLKYGPRLIARLRQWTTMPDDRSGSENPCKGSDFNVTPDVNCATSQNINGAIPFASTDGGDTALDNESQIVSDKLSYLQMNGNGSLPSLDSDLGVDNAGPEAAKTSVTESETLPSCESSNVQMEVVSSSVSPGSKWKSPEFPLFPVSRGFCLTLGKTLNDFEKSLHILKSQ